VWNLSGTIPTLVYYGIQVLSPGWSYAATALICGVIALSIGSSWTTAGTIGVGLVGIAIMLGRFPGDHRRCGDFRRKALACQPVVGLSLSVVAVAAFGGFYLASRRSRVGFAASFVLTFMVLLSYMLTLEGAAAANGSQGGELSASADSVRELLTDFRGAVALIVGFYFGTDAAVSVVKIWRTESKDAQDVGRLDRDLAVP
jgi:Na+:H+ antiporter, NhaC family